MARKNLWTEWRAWCTSKPKRKSQMSKRDKLNDYMWNGRDGAYRFNVLECTMYRYRETNNNGT